MACTGRKVSISSLEQKIAKQKEALAKSKAKYEADKAEMLRLVQMRDAIQAKELMDAISKSRYSIGDVIKMVKGKKSDAEED